MDQGVKCMAVCPYMISITDLKDRFPLTSSIFAFVRILFASNLPF